MNNTVVLVHCSDIHCGPSPINNAFPWHHYKCYAHDTQLCLAMPPALERVRDITGLPDNQEPNVIVTGDLTAIGAEPEFTVAHSFLHSRWQVAQGLVAMNATGLTPLPVETVAGNHDQWNGNRLGMWGYNPTLAGTHFRRTPWREVCRAGAIEVELFGIDSNAGFGAWHPNWQAVGAFDLRPRGEWHRLKRMVRDSIAQGPSRGVQARVRVFVLHHSPSFPPRLNHSLSDDSKTALVELAGAANVPVCLSGHIHEFGHLALTTPNGGTLRDLRSPSTLQGPADRKKKKPGFWAHRVRWNGTGAEWHSWQFVWDHPWGFVPESQPSVSFAI